jgi:hypothetical protein
VRKIERMIKVYDYNIPRLSAVNVAETLKLASIPLRENPSKKNWEGSGPVVITTLKNQASNWCSTTR